jgi:hypothetical protein
MPPQQPQHRRSVRRPEVADSQNAARLGYAFHAKSFLHSTMKHFQITAIEVPVSTKNRLTPEKKCE